MNKSIDQRRVLVLQAGNGADTGPIFYVMAREQRVADNWALLHAAAEADAAGVSLVVAFVVGPMFLEENNRHTHWLVVSLQAIEALLQKKGIPFVVEVGPWAKTAASIVKRYHCQKIVLDMNPLQPVRSWRGELVAKVQCAVDVVDARNIVPVWFASTKAEFAAYTLRPKIHKLLPEFLVPYPSMQTPRAQAEFSPLDTDWEALKSYRLCKGQVATETFSIEPGPKAATAQLRYFISTHLAGYSTLRNDPNKAATSLLSPYLRWGNISSQTIALAIEKTSARGDDKAAYLEELIVRRELSDNYVWYTKHYRKVVGAHDWAQKSIAEHKNDVREYLYSFEEFEHATTHDELWNAAQRQMMSEGHMHGYLRMYWAKKILEWTPDVQTAIDTALTLNDRYELDGRDSNAVVGVMWSVCGVHDRAWADRPVFGKVRYMNFNGCKRKFGVAAYIAKYEDASSMLFHE